MTEPENSSIRRSKVGEQRTNRQTLVMTEGPTGGRSMQMIDRQLLETPFYVVRQMTWHLQNEGLPVSQERIRMPMRLMRLMPGLNTQHSYRCHGQLESAGRLSSSLVRSADKSRCRQLRTLSLP